jgi:hypothetical protein
MGEEARMDEDQVRRAIAHIVEQMAEEGISMDHGDGILRGLLWALTGRDPGTYLSEDLVKVFRLAGIGFRVDGRKVIFAVPEDECWPRLMDGA